jgi:hypothetical protein
VSNSTQPQPFSEPFDERAALEELEQLAEKIQRSRRQRAQTVAEFDAFVRTFREDRLTESIAATTLEQRRADDRSAVLTAATHASPAVTLEDSANAQPVLGSAVTPVRVHEAAPWDEAISRDPDADPVSRRPRAPYIGVALAALALVGVAVLLWRPATSPVGPPAPSAPVATPAASTGPASTTASAPTAPAPAPVGPPRALNIELVAIRSVWARVTVDGRRAVASEIAAGTRMSFGADQAIAIRAGDAGAFRLVVDGKDLGVLGRDGQVYERVFAATTR